VARENRAAATVSRHTSVASVAMGSEPLRTQRGQCLRSPAWRSPSLALRRWGWNPVAAPIFSLLLGEFRAVFSLLLTIVLLCMGAGALVEVSCLGAGHPSG